MLLVSFPSVGLQWPGVGADILPCEVSIES